MKHCFSKMTILGIIAAWQLSAGTISGDNTGTAAADVAAYWGVNFVTPAGGPWNNLTFNFFSETAAANVPYAAGTLYLLSSNYTGLPTGLSAVTAPQLIASTSNINAAGEWVFAPSQTVSAGTQYYVFEGTLLPSTISGLGTGGGGVGFTGSENVYYTVDPAIAFAPLGLAVNYDFSGTVVTTSGTPEPTTLLLMAPALLLVLRRRLTR